MKTKTVFVLLAVAIIEGALIVDILSKPNLFRRIKVETTYTGMVNPSPLYWSLHYDVPDRRFEELVKKYPNFVQYRDPADGTTALFESLAYKRTNCARILIANGADIEEAAKEANKVHDEEVAKLLQQLQAEVKK